MMSIDIVISCISIPKTHQTPGVQGRSLDDPLSASSYNVYQATLEVIVPPNLANTFKLLTCERKQSFHTNPFFSIKTQGSYL